MKKWNGIFYPSFGRTKTNLNFGYLSKKFSFCTLGEWLNNEKSMNI
jgi:hypothetical protein